MNKLPSLKNLKVQLKKKQSFFYIINKKKTLLHRIKFRVFIKNPEEWLSAQPLFPKVFWEKPHSKKTVISLGSILNYETIPNLKTSFPLQEGPKFFGTTQFSDTLLSKTKYNVWNGFTPFACFLPQIELSLNKNRHGILFLNFLKHHTSDELKEVLDKLQTDFPSFPDLDLNITGRIDMPNFSTWCDTIEKSLHSFETTSLEKVVLARASYLTYKTPLNPFNLIKHLAIKAKNSTLFTYMPSKEGAFIGASPETFYKRTNQHLLTEAVAGTSAKGASNEANKILIDSLQKNEKNIREFNYVSNFLEKQLSLLCENHPTKLQGKVKETSTVYHLYKTFQGFLKKEITDKTLIANLHPTPAVGGHPKLLAMEFLDQSEPFVRGLYASPIGWISPYASDLIVAIRSAFIKNQQMTVFAGAGIVKGSSPLKEWEELELKISHFLNIKSKCNTV